VLKKYPEIAFDASKLDGNDSTNTYVQAGYTVTASSQFSGYHPWEAFDEITGNGTQYWSGSTVKYATTGDYGFLSGNAVAPYLTTVSDTVYNGEWIQLELPHKLKLSYVTFFPRLTNRFPRQGVFAGSNDGTNWDAIHIFSELTTTIETDVRITTDSENNTTAYKYIRLVITHLNGNDYAGADNIKLYGYEEDPPAGDTSIDTTFTSIMNTPQTTGANVYVDGSLGETFTNRVTGPTVSNTHTTYVSAEKYWELSGNVESNVTIEANTFLSGDAPHSVSMWFNSSNLEANTSNSCIFSLGTDERFDHVGTAFSNNYQTVQKLLASDGAAGDRFGSGYGAKGLSMSGDGSIIVIGAYLHNSQTGAAYVFIKNASGQWKEVQKLTASDAESGDYFGEATAISSDGNYIAIGARLAHSTDGLDTSNVGKLYIFKKTAGTNSWSEQQILSSSQEDQDDHFGRRVSISGDGTYVVAAAQNDDEDVNNGGGVYVFKRTGNTWSTGYRLSITGVSDSDFIASSLEISTDGNFLTLGVAGDNGVNADDDGAVYMFARTGDNTWTQQQKINNPDVSGTNNYFGGESHGVSISSDGTYLIVGADGRASQVGAVFFFKRTGSSTSDWTWSQMGGTYTEPGGLFGRAVIMSPDGLTALVHSRNDTDVTDGGAVYLYTRSGNTWTLKYTILHADTTASDHFGSVLDISSDGSYFVAGMSRDDDLGTDAGAVYVYARDTTHHLMTDLKLQSNTWHNLTYAYQGEGGSRVTYLDGRKVAEDQAEDTFGAYPPFAMTGPSQGGYVVSVSGETISPARLGWKAWNDDTSDRWGVGGELANDSRASAQNFVNPITDVLGVEHQGVWNTLEFPSKFKVSSLNVFSTGNTLNAQRRFRAGKLFGSNDNHNFYLLGEFESSSSTTDENTFAINSQVAYKYITFLVYKVWGTDDAVYIHRLRLYGHRENDLVRLPDPTNVLKYPHIAMTGPAQRGYVASASSENNGTTSGFAYLAFDGIADGTRGYHSTGGTYSSGVYQGIAKLTGPGPIDYDGEWIKLELPHKIKVTGVSFAPRVESEVDYYHRIPHKGYILGSNTGSDGSWELVHSFDNVTTTDGVTKRIDFTGTNAFYKYIAMVAEEVGLDAGVGDVLNFAEMEYFGTEEATSVPIQIGGGNIDKVANFRVYDKFVGEDQALEIWDAQKDTFRGVKNSMTLHKGRLGIGTTEPEGRLVVADEPDPDAYGLQEFPPRGMGGNETLIEGHGVFKASASSRYPTDDYYAWKAFDHDWGRTLGSWTSASGTVSNTTGLPTSTAANFQGISGNWLQLKLPYKIQLKQFKIESRGSSSYVPEELPGSGIVYGSNDEVNWDVVHSFNNVDYGGTTGGIRPMFTVNSTVSYSIFRVLVTKNYLISGATWTSIGEWRLFGYREQVTKQSVLHDGQLTLTKNLTVPRIGPPLDADDTPRRDRLVVEYNTSTNPTFEGAVRDTSGRGLDGMFYGGASYNATKKALVFDGTDDYIFVGNLNNPAGAWAHSYSFWVNFDGTSDEMLVQFGKEGASKSSSLRLNSSTELIWFFNSYSTTYTCSISTAATTWYHISAVYDGNLGMSVYINGAPLAVASSTLTTPANYDANEPLYIGTRVSKLNWLDGSISNFKLYDCALTAEEVKTLYDMGQCDEGHHVVNFSKTRVGIGLGDGEAPTYTLDVRGQIRSQGSLVTSFTGQHKCVPEEPVEKGLIVSAKKNQYVKLNGSLDTGKSAITIDESLPIVSLSNVVQDKACFGVVSSTEEANTVYRVETTNGGVISYIPKTLGDNRAIVNSVGEGAIWVVNTNGSLESGDYITTSNVAGYGQKQEDDVLHNYTVAKITMDCDFTGSNVAVQTIKREETGLRTITEDVWNDLIDYDRSSNTETQYSNTLVPSAYSGQSGYTPREVTTIVDYTDGSNLISIAEWSNLESNIQNTYQSNTFTEIADYTKFISLDEWSNLTVDVQNTYSEAEITTYYQIKRGENVLDENGQLQFEDKTGATEAPYERRFLDASGAQTDEANAVHIAAFVGCTYHCG
jgi:hypothetical protein